MVNAELFGRRLVGVPLGRTQDEDAAIKITEVVEFDEDSFRERTINHLLLDVDSVGDLRELCRAFTFTAPLTHPIRRLKTADRAEPRQERFAGEFKSREFAPRHNECLLHHVFGVTDVTKEPVCDPVDRPRVCAIQRAERMVAARGSSRYEVGIAHGGHATPIL